MLQPSYDQVLSSAEFLEDLAALNGAIVASLRAAGERVAINGNVLFEDRIENLAEAPLAPAMDGKRRALFLLAREVGCFAEVGVAGGHAALLALHANPELQFVGIDLGERLKPSWPRVDIFVPAAFAWLEARFPGRVRLYRAQAEDGLARAVLERPFGDIGLLHLDAGKTRRLAELRAAWPGLTPAAYLMQGDGRNGRVRDSTARMIAHGLARPTKRADLAAIRHPNYQLLEAGSAVRSASIDPDRLAGKRILVCTAHQDDETLFAGSLLSRLSGQADLTVCCFFRPAPNRRDTGTRETALAQVCARLGAAYIQYPFACEPEYPRLARFQPRVGTGSRRMLLRGAWGRRSRG